MCNLYKDIHRTFLVRVLSFTLYSLKKFSFFFFFFLKNSTFKSKKIYRPNMGKTIVPTVSFLFLPVLIHSVRLQLPGREEAEPGAGTGGLRSGARPHLHVHGHVQAFAGRRRRLPGFPLLLLLQPLLSQALLLFLGRSGGRGLATVRGSPRTPPPAPRGQTPREPQARSPSPSSSSPPVPSAAAPSAAAAPSPAPALAAPWGPGDSLSGQEAASRPSAPREGACPLAEPR